MINCKSCGQNIITAEPISDSCIRLRIADVGDKECGLSRYGIYEKLPMPEFSSEEKGEKTKLFSVLVKNDDTVKAINEIREKYGEYCIEYVLRDYSFTEIIYKDAYKEI